MKSQKSKVKNQKSKVEEREEGTFAFCDLPFAF